MRAQRAHAGIDERIARATLNPRIQSFAVRLVGPEAPISPRKLLVLDTRLIFELLHEVITPGQPRRERLQRSQPCSVGRPSVTQLRASSLHRLPRLPAGHGAKRQVCTDTRAGGEGRHR